MSKPGASCDMITSPGCNGSDDVYCNKFAAVPYKGGGVGEYVCLDRAKSMADDDDLIDGDGRVVIAILEDALNWSGGHTPPIGDDVPLRVLLFGHAATPQMLEEDDAEWRLP